MIEKLSGIDLLQLLIDFKWQMARKAKGSMVFIGSMSGAIVNVPQPQA